MVKKTDMKHKNDRENRERLATDMVDSWDLNDLTGYAIDRLIEDLNRQTDSQFHESWIDFYMEDTELEN